MWCCHAQREDDMDRAEHPFRHRGIWPCSTNVNPPRIRLGFPFNQNNLGRSPYVELQRGDVELKPLSKLSQYVNSGPKKKKDPNDEPF